MGLSSSVHHLFLVSEPFSDNHPLCFLFVICSFSFRHLSFSYLPFSVIRCRGWSLLSVCEKLFIIKMASIRQIYGYHTDWKKCNNFRYQETVSFHSPTKSCQEANSQPNHWYIAIFWSLNEYYKTIRTQFVTFDSSRYDQSDALSCSV